MTYVITYKRYTNELAIGASERFGGQILTHTRKRVYAKKHVCIHDCFLVGNPSVGMPFSGPNFPILFPRSTVLILDYYDMPIFPVFLLSLLDIGIGEGGAYIGVNLSSELPSSSHFFNPKYWHLLTFHL